MVVYILDEIEDIETLTFILDSHKPQKCDQGWERMALPLIKSPMTSCRVLSSLRGRQVDPVAGAENLRLGHRSGARTDAGHGIVTAIVGEQYIYVDCPLSTGNVVTHEIEATRT